MHAPQSFRALLTLKWMAPILALSVLLSCAEKSGLRADVFPPAPGTFRFIAWADTKTGTSVLTDESIIADGLDPAFTLYAGDLIDCNASNNPGCFSAGFSAWKRALNGGGRNNLFNKSFFTRGNHDANAEAPWEEQFDFAAAAARVGAANYAALIPNMTYSFDYGNSHFAGLDVPGGAVSTITAGQIAWLDDDLTAAEGRGLAHAFLFWHGPVYYVDGHISTAPAALIAVLNRHPIVSAVFAGHEHLVAYVHIDSSRIPAVTHPFEEFISGAAGAELYTAEADRYDYWLHDGSGFGKEGFVAVDVAGDHFTVTVYTSDGSIDTILSFYHDGNAQIPTGGPPDVHDER